MVTQVVADVYATGNGTTLTTQLQYPAGIVAGDTLLLFGLTNGVAGSAKATGTGVTVPSGFAEDTTDAASPHAYSSSMCVTVWKKTAAGTETGGVGVTWGGGSAASRSAWGIMVIPAGWTYRGVVWNDQASLTNDTVGVPAFSHTGADMWASLGFERGSTPSTGWTTSPADTLLDSAFGTSTGACSMGIARADTADRDGSVGAGSWVTNTANSAGRTAATVVATLPRITKTVSTTWDTKARVAKSTVTTWETRARVAKSTATTWETRARITKALSTTWDVAGSLARITKTVSTTWETRARVAKTQATTWDVAGSLARITKTITTTWNTRARVAKSQATTWQTRARVVKSLATTWNVASMISEASWPAFIGHRGSDPGPEETLFAYDALYAKSPNFWHEGDGQALNDGSTMVSNHDDDVDRMYSSGPVSTGNVSSISPANWALEKWRRNTGFTGSDEFAMFMSDWTTKYGKQTATPAVGLWECKTGTDIADWIACLAGCQGTVVINCNSLADAQAAVAAGFDACLQTNSPTFSQFTANGIKYLSINYTSMTGTIATNAIAAGVKVLMYTVNSTANRDSMLALFSDTSFAGFISNKPLTLAGTTRITKTISTTWNVRARVAKSTSTTWTTRARVAKTQATTWETRARVAKSVATTWQTRARVVKALSTTWDVASTVSPANRMKVWNGSAWVTKPVKVWNGSAYT